MLNFLKNRYLYSFASFNASIVIGFLALYMPPIGIIDNSVLWFIAQLLLFTSSILGINYHVFESNKNKES